MLSLTKSFTAKLLALVIVGTVALLWVFIAPSTNILAQDESENAAVLAESEAELVFVQDYKFTAETCDSLTKLVRRSLLTYDEANPKLKLTKAGIIYAETNIVQNMGAYWLDVGQKVVVDGQAVSEYAEKSLELSESAIRAWSYYIPSVDFAITDIQKPSNDTDVREEIIQLTDDTYVEPVAEETESNTNLWWVAGIGSVTIVWYLLWKREDR